MEGIFAASHGTLVLLGLTVDGLDVHQQVVADTETTPTFLALQSGAKGSQLIWWEWGEGRVLELYPEFPGKGEH